MCINTSRPPLRWSSGLMHPTPSFKLKRSLLATVPLPTVLQHINNQSINQPTQQRVDVHQHQPTEMILGPVARGSLQNEQRLVQRAGVAWNEGWGYGGVTVGCRLVEIVAKVLNVRDNCVLFNQKVISNKKCKMPLASRSHGARSERTRISLFFCDTITTHYYF